MHPVNTPFPIARTVFGIKILSSDLQPVKALSPIFSTPSVIYIFFKESQLANVYPSIKYRLGGNTISLKQSQFTKVLDPISSRPSAI